MYVYKITTKDQFCSIKLLMFCRMFCPMSIQTSGWCGTKIMCGWLATAYVFTISCMLLTYLSLYLPLCVTHVNRECFYHEHRLLLSFVCGFATVLYGNRLWLHFCFCLKLTQIVVGYAVSYLNFSHFYLYWNNNMPKWVCLTVYFVIILMVWVNK